MFCHEDAEPCGLRRDKRRSSMTTASRANAYANMLGPIIEQHRQCAVCHSGALSAACSCWQTCPNVSISGHGVRHEHPRAVPQHDQAVHRQRQPALPADKRHRHGHGAGAERIFALHGRKAGGGRRLCHPRQREDIAPDGDDRQRCAERTGHVGVEAPAQADGSRHLYRAARRRPHGRCRFRLRGRARMVLHDMSLYAEPGQKVAFVGATGAGKTTITNLINRFYDIADGKIRYDGININKIKKSDLRRSPRHRAPGHEPVHRHGAWTTSATAQLDATDEECIAAAKLAGADDFITRLPDGYRHDAHEQRREPLAGSAAAYRPSRAPRWPTRRS